MDMEIYEENFYGLENTIPKEMNFNYEILRVKDLK